jgi:hypothetical protein
MSDVRYGPYGPDRKRMDEATERQRLIRKRYQDAGRRTIAQDTGRDYGDVSENLKTDLDDLVRIIDDLNESFTIFDERYRITIFARSVTREDYVDTISNKELIEKELKKHALAIDQTRGECLLRYRDDIITEAGKIMSMNETIDVADRTIWARFDAIVSECKKYAKNILRLDLMPTEEFEGAISKYVEITYPLYYSYYLCYDKMFDQVQKVLKDHKSFGS